MFANNAGNTMKTVQGWPVATRYLSNTSDNGSMEQRNYKAVDLSNGTSAAVSSTTGAADLPDRADSRGEPNPAGSGRSGDAGYHL
ncbi:adhesion domain-containing protein [Pseudomonas aeruginosa]|uniref:adhesion domain-containing protein n=1 Tax=Pseudomonas aeruginosa TaxID=287 RepID=UPI003D1881EC